MRKGEPGNRPPVRTTWARTRWPYRLLRPWLRPYQVDALCQAWLLCPSVAVELLLRRSPQALIAMLQCSAPTGVRFSPEPAAEPPAAKRGRTGARSLPLESSTPPGTDRRSSGGLGVRVHEWQHLPRQPVHETASTAYSLAGYGHAFAAADTRPDGKSLLQRRLSCARGLCHPGQCTSEGHNPLARRPILPSVDKPHWLAGARGNRSTGRQATNLARMLRTRSRMETT